MKIYENIPPITLEDSPEDFIARCSALVKWAGNNLPIVCRINRMAEIYHWTNYERTTAIAAYMARAYVEQLNISLAWQQNSPLFVSTDETEAERRERHEDEPRIQPHVARNDRISEMMDRRGPGERG